MTPGERFLTDSGLYNKPLVDVDMLPQGILDDLVVQAVAAAFARNPLEIDELRDIRLVAFLLDVLGRISDQQLAERSSGLLRVVVADDRLRSISGLSAGRMQRSLSRLVEARVLEQVADDPPGWFRLAARAMGPVGVDQYVSWNAVAGKIAGRVPCNSTSPSYPRSGNCSMGLDSPDVSAIGSSCFVLIRDGAAWCDAAA